MSEKPPVPKQIQEHSAQERHEAKELFRASLGFDFVFYNDSTGRRRCACIEINGSDTGIHGIDDIPEGGIPELERAIANIRSTKNPEFISYTHKADAVFKDLHTGDFPTSSPAMKIFIEDVILKNIKRRPHFTHAFKNPDFIQHIADHKDLQTEFIPAQHRPRTWHEGDSPISPTGEWIVKPNTGRGGTGIQILTNAEFQSHFLALKRDIRRQYTVQALLPTLGADNAPETNAKSPSSLRLLMDFLYLDDGTIVPAYVTAYQRIAPQGDRDIDDTLIVNKARGALSAAASKEEISLARPIAEAIIERIGRVYLVDPNPEAKTRTHTNAQELLKEIEAEMALHRDPYETKPKTHDGPPTEQWTVTMQNMPNNETRENDTSVPPPQRNDYKKLSDTMLANDDD